jgi:hypothetical protein
MGTCNFIPQAMLEFGVAVDALADDCQAVVPELAVGDVDA